MRPFSSFLVTLARRASYVALTGALAMVVQLICVDAAQAQATRTHYVTGYQCNTITTNFRLNINGEWLADANTGNYTVYCHPTREQASSNTEWVELRVFYNKSSTYVATDPIIGQGYIGTTWGAWFSPNGSDVVYTNGPSSFALRRQGSLTAPNVQYRFYVTLPADTTAGSGPVPHSRFYGYKLVVNI